MKGTKPEEKERLEGTVVFFLERGFGFIHCHERNEDYFAHYAHIVNEERYKELNKGAKVTFEGTMTPKGLMAVNIIQEMEVRNGR